MLFLEHLRATCRNDPEKIAIDFRDGSDNKCLSYGDLLGSTSRAAAWLAGHGVEAGDRVAICLPKSVAAVQIHLAACSMGAVSLPVNPGYSPREVQYILQDSEARLLVVSNGLSDAAGEIALPPGSPTATVSIIPEKFEGLLPSHGLDLDRVGIDPGATALMLYTSGTTGKPKGACMSHASLTANIEMLNEAWEWSAQDVLLHALPLFHVHGLLVALHGALHAAATALMHAEFDARTVLQALQTGGATVFMAVPTMYRRLLDAAEGRRLDLRHMRLLTSGSDRLPVDLFREIEERFGMRPVERYGMTETGIMLSNPLDGERVAGQVGIPLPRVEMRIVDPESGHPVEAGTVGELQTRGPHVFSGYWKAPEKTRESFTEDGWFRTGDLGLRDANGRYELKGRGTDLIISGGFNVYPSEVEQVLLAHQDVEQCAVVGLPDPDWGESVTAVVVAREEALDEAKVIEHCRRFLASYKTPKRVEFVRSLPRNAMGKVQKDALRASLQHTVSGR